MATKQIKNLLANTSTQSRLPAIQSFSSAGVFTGSSGSGATTDVGEQVATLSKNLNDLQLAQQQALDSLNQNTQALVQNTVTKSSASASSSTAGGLLSQIGSTLTLSPLVNGLLSLFGGGGSTATPQPLAPFSLPASVQYEGAYSSTNGGQVTGINYGQSGTTRASAATPATNVQIQVNAMDSRSFLDHSADIAAAVREAILHSNSLNDVIADL